MTFCVNSAGNQKITAGARVFRSAVLAGLLLCGSALAAPAPLTFCNPLNLDYGPGNSSNGSRHAADPVIVLFKNRYYLFDTWDKPGYRVSDDLVHWKVIPFDAATLPLATKTNDKGLSEITAPAVVTDGRYLYYSTFGNTNLIRTADPDSGKWEFYKTISGEGDPDFFIDRDGKFYLAAGMNQTHIRQLDPETFKEVKGTRTLLTPEYRTFAQVLAANPPYGLYLGKSAYGTVNWDKRNAIDTEQIIPRMLNPKSKEPMQEGAWLTERNGRYYLQNSGPDTSCPWYSDTVWESDSVLGPYKLADYAPAAMKVGGFINSAGHSCVFQDRYQNWWRVTTMWIGVLGGFERRIGLFPVGFDDKARMFTRTELGDYPMVVPNEPVDFSKQSMLAGWSVLSTDKASTASSTLNDKRSPSAATDENVRTWWSAKTGDPGEWFQMDLGKEMTVRAVQVNFAEQDTKRDPLSEDYTAYRLLASNDGRSWKTILDKSANKTAAPHDYTVFNPPLKTRFLKVENVHAAEQGKFAIRDLRVFGNGGGPAPVPATDLQVARHEDARHVTFTWKPSSNANGYVIRYGVAPDALHLNLQVQGGDTSKLTVSCLNRDVKYFYRIDSYNENGLVAGGPPVGPL